MIAALYVQKNGAYFGVPGIDPWDEARDARRYEGPHAVIAHPPCARWCRLAGLVESRWGRKKGDDGGCFASALAAVRKYHGVLEHPAFSDAWDAYGMAKPDTKGGWTEPDQYGGRSCHVEQRNYGHRANKATWLYVVTRAPLPELVWGRAPGKPTAVVGSYCVLPDKTIRRSRAGVERMGKAERSATPPAFKAVLFNIAYFASLCRKP